MEKGHMYETHYTLDVVVNGNEVIPIFYKSSSDESAIRSVKTMIECGLINSSQTVNGCGYLEGMALSLMSPEGENLPINKDLSKMLHENTVFERREALHGT